MIYVVNKYTTGNFEDLSVHLDDDALVVVRADCPHSIESAPAPADVPFVFSQPVEVVRVNNGVFALRKRYASEDVAVTNAAVE